MLQFFENFCLMAAQYLRLIGFCNLMARVLNLLGKFPVVCEDQGTFRVQVQSSNRKQTGVDAMQQGGDDGASLRI